MGANYNLLVLGVATQYREGVMVAGFNDALQFRLEFRTRHVAVPVFGWRWGHARRWRMLQTGAGL